MTRVSKHPVKDFILQKISEQLVSYVASISSERNSSVFLSELFSDSERMMIAKRLAIIVMLTRGYSYITIKKTLRVSIDTIARMRREKEHGRYAYISKHCGTRYRPTEGEESFWDTLETILQAGMPPRGKGRWRFLDEIMEKDQRRKNATKD